MKALISLAVLIHLSLGIAGNNTAKELEKLTSSGQQLTEQDAQNIMISTMSEVKISKAEMIKAIDQMVSSGQITKKDGDAAKKQIGGMSDGDLEKFRASIIHMMMGGQKKRK